MKVEVGTFPNGQLKVTVVFEPNSNFWKENLTWVPTFREIKLIILALLGLDGINNLLRKYDAE